MPSDRRLLAALRSMSEDRAFQVHLAQVRARAVLTELAAELPAYKWTYVPDRLVRNLTAGLFDLETVSLSEPAAIDEVSGQARQVAQAWESLARLEEKTSRPVAYVNAAAAYELAGYQANAACLARQLVRNPRSIEQPSEIELTALFVQRLMVAVRELSAGLMREPSANGFNPQEMVGIAARALMAKGLTHAAAYFLRGATTRLEEAERALALAERGYSSEGFVPQANLVHTLRSVIPVMARRSTWNVLGGSVPDSYRWERYLKLLARGVGQDVYASPSVSELWPSQLAALRGGLLSSNASAVIKMPTSAGKTRVAELAIVHTLVTQPGAKCIYVAPYRALVSELQHVFMSLLSDLGFQVASVVGSYESDAFEEELAREADVLVVTPEKLDLLFRLQRELVSQVRLVILDEGQLVDDRVRGVKFDILLTRLKRTLPEARVLFASAVVPQESLEELATWFARQVPATIVSSDWRPAIQRYARLEWRQGVGTLQYGRTDEVDLLAEFVPGFIRRQTFSFINPATGRVNRRQVPGDSKSEIAAELAFKLAALGPVLVFCSQQNFAESVAGALARRLSLLETVQEAVRSYFVTSETRARAVAKAWLGAEHSVTDWLSRGIAIHHGDVPDAVRKAVEADFRDRRYRVIVATNTLAQGVNLPLRTVVVHSCWRGDATGERHRIPARDYWNIAGRAGRAREETEGTVIHIVVSEQDSRDVAYYHASRENVEPVESAIFQMVKELVEGRLTTAAVAEIIDPEILALLVEEAAQGDDGVFEVLRETLGYQQAGGPAKRGHNRVRRCSEGSHE